MPALAGGSIAAAALAYAGHGWPVFPCDPRPGERAKRPLTQGAGGRGGLHLASCDAATVADWWRRWPDALIGIPTGDPPGGCGAFVIDLDPRQHDADAMACALDEWARLPPGPVSQTQSGGLHFWFVMPALAPGAKLGNRAGLFRHVAAAPVALRAHVDVRGQGGYVVVPPSRMVSGAGYVWRRRPSQTGLPPAPARLLDLILRRSPAPAPAPAPAPVALAVPDWRCRRYCAAVLDRAVEAAATAPAGSRNNELNRSAFALGQLVGAGVLARGEAERQLATAAERSGHAGRHSPRAVAATIRSGLDAGAQHPFDLSRIGQGERR